MSDDLKMTEDEVCGMLKRAGFGEKAIKIEMASAVKNGHSIQTPHGELWVVRGESITWICDETKVLKKL